MNNTLNMVLRTTLTAAGAAVAGSAGGILGGFVAGLLATAIPGAADVIGNVVTQITNESLASASQGIIKRLEPSEKHLLNKDLQMAFRQAMVEGLYDIGGPLCFQKAWKSAGRDVNETIVLPLLRKENQAKESQSTLYQQTCQCLQDLEKEMSEGVLLPLEPPSNQPGAQVQSFLGAELPQELDRIFFDQVIAPWLKKYRALAQELPELPYYLRTNLLDRTLVHLDDILLNNAPAWNAFNRLMMEQMQSNLRDVGEQQSELFKKLEMMVDRKDETALVEWSASAATLISATGRLEKKQDENFSQLMQRTAEQHSEVMQHLQTILAVNERIEKKVERVLRYLENGQWIIEGARPDAAFQVPYPGEPPFMGMEYFDTQDASLFFGRQELITRLTTRIQKQSFLAVIGSSGSGKSSLVRAGVVPSLLEKRWKIHIFTPTDHPLLALASTLTRDGSLNATRELARDLEEDPQTLSLASRKLIDTASTGILFVIDQFEELFTLCQNEIEKSCFINNLVEAVGEAKSPIKVLLTLRADFYGACAEYAPLRQLLSTNQEFIGAMSTQELRQAIEEPARLNGWSFEPGLVELILRDAGQEPGTLPLLSHALLETWKHRRGKTMLLESYAEAGGVQGAIAHTADRVYQHGLDLSEQEIARNIFLRLTTLGEGTQDTRRRADLGELISSPDQKKKVESVIRSLADARLITIQENTVEVAHEALIREWPALRQWLEENRESLRTQRRIEDAAKEWVRLGKDQAQLIKGKKLAEAKEWADSSPLQISNLENEYLVASLEAAEKEMAEEASRKQREVEKSRQLVDVLRLRVEEQAEHTKRLKRRAYMLTAALAIAAVLAAAAGIFASLSNKNAAEANRQTLRARAGELSAQAKLMQEQFPQRAALLAMEAVNLDVRASQPPDPLALTVLWQTATQRRSTLLPGIQAELL
ncbi:MAG: hypothetical protein HGA53_04970, partial [Anaerolineaceae bacterium]|nr:hypothetical protein [Anaerolineaceae bacterium]